MSCRHAGHVVAVGCAHSVLQSVWQRHSESDTHVWRR